MGAEDSPPVIAYSEWFERRLRCFELEEISLKDLRKAESLLSRLSAIASGGSLEERRAYALCLGPHV